MDIWIFKTLSFPEYNTCFELPYIPFPFPVQIVFNFSFLWLMVNSIQIPHPEMKADKF